MLPKIALGKTGFTLSRLGIGGFHQVEISSEIISQIVDAFLDAGGNYIETARSYGNGASEEKLGRVLEGRRDKVILASKSGKRDGEGVRRELEASLTALRTDHIEFYFFHGVNTLEELDTVTGPGGAPVAGSKTVGKLPGVTGAKYAVMGVAGKWLVESGASPKSLAKTRSTMSLVSSGFCWRR